MPVRLRSIREKLAFCLYRTAERIDMGDSHHRQSGARLQGTATITVINPDLTPDEVKIDKTDPYRGDLLERKTFGDGIERLVSYGSGKGVIFIDGGWGVGKTTFLRMWTEEMRRKGYVIATVNAWEGDYQDRPLDDLIKQLQRELERAMGWTHRSTGKTWRFRLQWVETCWLWLTATFGTVDSGATIAVTAAIKGLIRALGIASRTADDGGRISELRTRMADGANRLATTEALRRRLIVTIDELDRCRPDYALRFLETIKHVFEVDHITFVVAANKVELANAVKGIYGADFDGSAYLERFFDVFLRIPTGPRGAFVRRIVQEAKLESAFGCSLDEGVHLPATTAEGILIYLLQYSELSSREIKKAIKHISIVLLFNRELLVGGATSAVALTALRAVSRKAYDDLEEGKVGYGRAVNTVLECLGKNRESNDPELRAILDIMYWCSEETQRELDSGERSRRLEPLTMWKTGGNDERQAARQRESWETRVRYGATRRVIEMIADKGS